MSWNRLVFWIGSAAVATLMTVLLTPMSNIAAHAMSVQEELTPSDAIVVLGGGLMVDGTLRYESMQRLVYGLRLYKQGLAPILILSGPARENTAPESTVRARIATELGIPPSAILEISNVQTTREEAREVANSLGKQHLKHVLLVTEPLHMKRSKMVFEAAGLQVSPALSDNFPSIASSPKDRLFLFFQVLMQSAGFAYYKIAGFI